MKRESLPRYLGLKAEERTMYSEAELGDQQQHELLPAGPSFSQNRLKPAVLARAGQHGAEKNVPYR